MILPVVYSVKYKRESLGAIVTVLLVMAVIVISYWPLLTSNFLNSYTYVAVKILLFVLLPLLAFLLIQRNVSSLHVSHYGVKKEGVVESIRWCVLFLPLMFVVTGIVHTVSGVTWTADVSAGLLSFFEAFTEEFFFRGILFIFLLRQTNITTAYVTSLASFTLMHPQNLTTLFIIGTVLQGVLTLEIARRSHNVLGAWVLHGSTRLFQLAILPLLL